MRDSSHDNWMDFLKKSEQNCCHCQAHYISIGQTKDVGERSIIMMKKRKKETLSEITNAGLVVSKRMDMKARTHILSH